MNKKTKNIVSVIQSVAKNLGGTQWMPSGSLTALHMTKSTLYSVLCTLCTVLFLASCTDESLVDNPQAQNAFRTVSVDLGMPQGKPAFGEGTTSRAADAEKPAEILLGDSTLAVSRTSSDTYYTTSNWVDGDWLLVKIDAGSTQGRLTLEYHDSEERPTQGWHLLKDCSYFKYKGDTYYWYNADELPQGVLPILEITESEENAVPIDTSNPLTIHLDWTATAPTVSLIYINPESMTWDNTGKLSYNRGATEAPELWIADGTAWTTPQARLRVHTSAKGDVVKLTSSVFDTASDDEPGTYEATTDAQGNAYFYGTTEGELDGDFIVQLTQMRVPVPQPAAPASEGRSVALDNAKENVIITLDTPITLLEASDVVPVKLAATKAYKLIMSADKRNTQVSANLSVIDGSCTNLDLITKQIETAMAMDIYDFTVVNGLATSLVDEDYITIVSQAISASGASAGSISLVLHESITSVPNTAFLFCEALNSISASHVESIGEGAFALSGLTKATFDAAKTIGECAFQELILEEITFGQVIETITDYAFDTFPQGSLQTTSGCDLTLAEGQQEQTGNLKVTAVGGKLMWAGEEWKSIKVGETEYTAVGDVLCSTNNGVPTTVIDDVTYAVIDGQCGITETDDEGNYIGTADHVTTLKAQIDAAMAMEIDHFLVINQLAKYETSTVETAVGAAIRELTSDENSSSNNGTIHITLQDATQVADYAFSGCRALKSVTVSAANAIGFSAFSGCFGLTTVTLPNVITIDGSAFSSCTALTTVDLQNATTIRSEAFKGCTALTHTGIPWNMITSIDQYAFRGCTFTGTITIGEGVSVNADAFDDANVSNCDLVLPAGQVTGITISNGTLKWAGAEWESITLLDGPNGTAGTKYYIDNGMPTVEIDGTCGITGNNPIGEETHVSAMEQKIKVVAVAATANAPAKVIVKKGLASFGGLSKTVVGNAINRGYVHLVLDDAITSIPKEAFENNGVLVSVTTSATTIGESAFYGCSSLTSVSLRATSATTIGEIAFMACSHLATVDLSANTAIGESAFKDCFELTGMDWTKVTSIGVQAFLSCSSLTGELSLPNVTSIGDDSFQGCIFTKVTFGKVVTGYESTFEFANVSNCDLELAAGQSGVTTENGKLMWAGAEWKSITMGDRVYTQMNGFVKLEKAGVIYAVIDGSLTDYQSIKNQVTTALAADIYNLYVANGLATYSNQGSAGSVVGEAIRQLVPELVPTSTEAVDYNGSIILTLADATEVIDGAFYKCKALKSVSAPGAYQIGDAAFESCTNLQSVEIGENAVGEITIGEYAFQNDANLRVIKFYKVVESVGSGAFDGVIYQSCILYLNENQTHGDPNGSYWLDVQWQYIDPYF